MDSQILNALHKRYATKLFDTTKKVPQEKLDTLLESVRLAPSSLGVEPWKILVITNPEIREKLKAAAWGQPQVTDASHLIVFTYRTNLKEGHVNKVIDRTAKSRNQEHSELEGYKQMIEGSLSGMTPEMVNNWAEKQCYIPLGMLVETAALLDIDAAPMEGFDKNQFNEILGLKEKNLSTAVICGLGYRSSDDQYAKAPKSRFAKEDVIEFI